MDLLKIGFFADGIWAHKTLEKYICDSTISVSFICGRHEHPDHILKALSENNSIDFMTHPNINSNDFLQRINKYAIDLIVSMSFDQIFKNRLINYPRLKSINCHAGKLPFYRGRNVLNWALINDEKNFGITVHYIDEGIDTGDIIAQQLFEINDQDTYATLLERAHIGCSDLLYKATKQIQSRQINTISQRDIHPLGLYCTARIKGDEKLDWNQSSRDIFNFVRALCKPGPQARTHLGDKELRLNRVKILPDAPIYKGIPGAVVGVDFDGFYVKTRDSFVKVIEWFGIKSVRTGDRLK
jgi:methionyl-tRNA formyltransferase